MMCFEAKPDQVRSHFFEDQPFIKKHFGFVMNLQTDIKASFTKV